MAHKTKLSKPVLPFAINIHEVETLFVAVRVLGGVLSVRVCPGTDDDEMVQVVKIKGLNLQVSSGEWYPFHEVVHQEWSLSSVNPTKEFLEKYDPIEGVLRHDKSSIRGMTFARLVHQLPSQWGNVVVLDARLHNTAELIKAGVQASRIVLVERELQTAFYQRLLSLVLWDEQPVIVWGKLETYLTRHKLDIVAAYIDFCGHIQKSVFRLLPGMKHMRVYGVTCSRRNLSKSKSSTTHIMSGPKKFQPVQHALYRQQKVCTAFYVRQDYAGDVDVAEHLVKRVVSHRYRGRKLFYVVEWDHWFSEKNTPARVKQIDRFSEIPPAESFSEMIEEYWEHRQTTRAYAKATEKVC